MKKVIFTTTILFNLLFLGTSNLFAQTANEPGSGNALSFDGSNEYVFIGNPTLLENTFAGAGKKFTITLWMYLNSANLNRIILAKYADGNCNADEREIALNIWPSGQLDFGYYMNDLVNYWHRHVATTTVIPQNKWMHVGIVYDGTINTNNGLDRVLIYLNGVQQTTTLIAQNGGFPGDIIVAPSPLVIGTMVESTGIPCSNFSFDGQIDEVRIWNRALSQTEIRQNMTQKLTGNEPGLVGYWRFDEGSGTTAFDSSPNGNNGTLY